jgi:hypothetical protein
MKASAPPSLSKSTDPLLLLMRDLAQHFNPPPVDPLSPSPPEVLGISGAQYVLRQLETRRHVKAETLHLVLPDGKLAPALADRTRQALERYAQYRIQEQEALARETRRRGLRVTVAALALLAFFLSLSNLFASDITEGMRPLLRKTLEYGFEIVGWVMLWHPIEALVFEPITIKHKVTALRRLMDLRVVESRETSCSKRLQKIVRDMSNSNHFRNPRLVRRDAAVVLVTSRKGRRTESFRVRAAARV